MFRPFVTLSQNNPKLTPQPDHVRTRAKRPTLYFSSTNSLDTLCNLAPQDFLASWHHGVTSRGQDAKIGKIGQDWHLWRSCQAKP